MEEEEQPQEQTRTMDFGQALNRLKRGLMVQWAGWNGKGMFLFIRPEFECAEETFLKIVSVPENVKQKIVKQINDPAFTYYRGGPETVYRFTAYISMFAADGSIVNGWLVSQT